MPTLNSVVIYYSYLLESSYIYRVQNKCELVILQS